MAPRGDPPTGRGRGAPGDLRVMLVEPVVGQAPIPTDRRELLLGLKVLAGASARTGVRRPVSPSRSGQHPVPSRGHCQLGEAKATPLPGGRPSRAGASCLHRAAASRPARCETRRRAHENAASDCDRTPGLPHSRSRPIRRALQGPASALNLVAQLSPWLHGVRQRGPMQPLRHHPHQQRGTIKSPEPASPPEASWPPSCTPFPSARI